ncbi:hypothetical protein P9239_01150 [Caballeronia sp. LZ062]|uniref:hypothetical protein n=1 Tax=unclassified Caballeronia TaxID=2646786 RepID=UPI00285944BE|nr:MULTISPECIES: hypothetical protein [unclassified Caballeronia]MDR5857414.1 hypothetical protein [Caballeronia sp. LZ050]MDR5868965.1 hypothetical protein [Caballeronia sp. LZ062]
MIQATGDNHGSRATADDMDEPVGAPAASETRQEDLDAREKQHHPQSENALPTAQDNNPVPPESTRE